MITCAVQQAAETATEASTANANKCSRASAETQKKLHVWLLRIALLKAQGQLTWSTKPICRLNCLLSGAPLRVMRPSLFNALQQKIQKLATDDAAEDALPFGVSWAKGEEHMSHGRSGGAKVEYLVR